MPARRLASRRPGELRRQYVKTQQPWVLDHTHVVHETWRKIHTYCLGYTPQPAACRRESGWLSSASLGRRAFRMYTLNDCVSVGLSRDGVLLLTAKEARLHAASGGFAQRSYHVRFHSSAADLWSSASRLLPEEPSTLKRAYAPTSIRCRDR